MSVPAKKSATDIDLGAVRLTATGVTFTAAPTLDEWRASFQFIKRCEGAVQFWLGDMVLAGENMFSQEASQEFDRETHRRWAWVCSRVTPELRRKALTWTHHEAVARLEPREQKHWLDRAEREGWSAAELKRQLKGQTKEDEEKYQCPTCGSKSWNGVHANANIT